jgi:hypothetical protein
MRRVTPGSPALHGQKLEAAAALGFGRQQALDPHAGSEQIAPRGPLVEETGVPQACDTV